MTLSPPHSSFSEVRVEDVCKAFGRTLALKRVSTHFRAGQVTLMLGPNGAGKSTLLSILSTLSRPTSGQIWYGDQEAANTDPLLRRQIGLLAHAPMLYPQLSGRENLRLFAKLHGLTSAEAEVKRALDKMELESVADQPVLSLSRGMLQRMSLARALLTHPTLLLLDEPFTGLDHQSTTILREELQTAKGSEKIIILVSHDLNALDELPDHLMILSQGRLLADLEGLSFKRDQILEHYRTALESHAHLCN